MSEVKSNNRFTLAAIVLPPVICLPGLIIEQGLSSLWSTLFFSLAIIVGTVCAVLSVGETWRRVVVGVLYIPLCAAALLVLSILVAGQLYHRYF